MRTATSRVAGESAVSLLAGLSAWTAGVGAGLLHAIDARHASVLQWKQWLKRRFMVCLGAAAGLDSRDEASKSCKTDPCPIARGPRQDQRVKRAATPAAI